MGDQAWTTESPAMGDGEHHKQHADKRHSERAVVMTPKNTNLTTAELRKKIDFAWAELKRIDMPQAKILHGYLQEEQRGLPKTLSMIEARLEMSRQDQDRRKFTQAAPAPAKAPAKVKAVSVPASGFRQTMAPVKPTPGGRMMSQAEIQAVIARGNKNAFCSISCV